MIESKYVWLLMVNQSNSNILVKFIWNFVLSSKTELESNIQVLRDKNEEMQEILSRLEGQESVDIDEVVVTTAPLYKQ